jgi:iron(III) transport system permease protein
VLPMLITLWAALLPYTRPPSFQALSDLSFRNFEALLRKPLVFRAFENTLILAASSGFICVLLASITSWIVVRSRARARWLLDVLAFLPLTIPGIALGVALVWIYLILPVPVYGTLWILLIGYSTTFLPAAMRFITPGLVQIHRELEESSYVAGATWWRTFKSIIFPLILPSAVGSALYVFMNVFRVLSMAIVVYTPKTVVVPVLIFQQWSESQQGNEIQALLITTAFVLMPFGFLYYWLNRKYGIGRRVSM